MRLAGGAGPVGFAGDNSGGNLAAVATRELSREGRAPGFQVLMYPMLDATASSPSCPDFATGYGFTRDKALWYFSQYPPAGIDRGDPRVSPLFEQDLSGLPPTLNDTAIVQLTGPVAPENGMQVMEDRVLAALEQRADGAAEAARSMVTALRERDWEGDDVLADQLDALLGSGVIADLRPLPVDLDELAGVLEGDPAYGGGRVDLATGEVWPEPAVDYALEIGQEDEDKSDDPDKRLWVHCEGSRDGYRDMERFIGTVRDPGRAERLEIAISGPGAFRGSRRS